MFNSLTAKLWIVVRFLLFGVGGFLLMLSRLGVLPRPYEQPFRMAACLRSDGHPWCIFYALRSRRVGSVGVFGRVSVYPSFNASSLLPFYPVGKLEGAAAPALVALVAYVLAKWHYWRAESQGLER